MTNELIQIKFKQRLNKLSSQDFDNLQCWGVVEAFNNAQLKWIRRQVIGVNSKQIGDEGSKNLIDDLQVILKRSNLNINVTNPRYVEATLPPDYLYHKKLEVVASKETCTNRLMTTYLVEEADSLNTEADHNSEPSFEWSETFYTIAGNKIRVYKNDFTVNTINLTYYRRPNDIKIEGCVDPSTGNTSTQNVLCEFKDDVVEIIIDEAISITASDIESFNQYSVAKQNVQNNT